MSIRGAIFSTSLQPAAQASTIANKNEHINNKHQQQKATTSKR
jgi:hypothetical protein